MSREEIHARQKRLVAASLIVVPDKVPAKDKPLTWDRP